MQLRTLNARLMAFALALAMATPACAGQSSRTSAARSTPIVNGEVTYPEPRSSQFTREQEIQAGREAAQEANKQLPVLPETHPVSRYISQLGRKLAAETPSPQWPYVFRVINQKEINAFALPGGPIYVNIGTIQAADTEAELAGVIGHEISHVYMRHATSNLGRQQTIGGIANVLGAILGARGGVLGTLGQIGVGVGASAFLTKYSREMESEADFVGSRIMYEAGEDPRGMVSFFEELEAQGSSRGPQFLSSHPDPGNRAEKVGESLRSLPRRTYQPDSADFRRIKAQVASMKPLTAEEIAQQQKQSGRGGPTGTIDPGRVSVSGSFETLEHRAYTVSYPSNWRVYGDESSAVTIAPEGGAASDGSVAYGVIISGFTPQGARSLEDATQQLIQSMQQSNPQIQVTSSARRVTVNGVQGLSVELRGPSPVRTNGGAAAERDWLVTLPTRDGAVVYAIFIAPEQDFNKLKPTYDQMLRTLRLTR